MKRILILSLLSLMTTTLALGRAATPSSNLSWADEPNISQVVQEWLTALMKNDLATLDRILAADYVVTTADGSVLTKEQDIAPIKSNDLKFELATIEELNVRVYGETAVATGIGVFKGTFKGRPFNSRERFTDVYVKRGGRWQAVASQSSTFPKQEAPAQPQKLPPESNSAAL